MLFSGGSSTKPKKEDKKDKKSERDEKYEVQENVMVRWVNSQLSGDRIADARGLHETSYAALIVQLIGGHPVVLSGNVIDDWALLVQTINDTKTNVSELCEGLQKAVLSFWWCLVQFYWKNTAPAEMRDERMTEAIKQWCLEATRGHEEVNVCDFTSSWRDGHAFNCLLHSYDKKLVNLGRVAEMSAIERIENAFAVAEKELRVARLLVAKELHSEHLDSHSVVCYLMTLYLSMLGQCTSSAQETTHSTVAATTATPVMTTAREVAHRVQSNPLLTSSGAQSQPRADEKPPMKARASIEGEQATDNAEVRSRKSSSSSQKSSKTKKLRKEEQSAEFENCIEQVLTWLLEADEQLTQLTTHQRTELPAVRSQFADFEVFMSSLTESQDTVGRVLLRGQVLGNKAENDEEREAITARLQLVNNKWETLREEAMRRQSQLQTQINSLQQKELEKINVWLTQTEAEIEGFEPLAQTSDDALRQIVEHDRFQQKIDEYQHTIDKLESFVAVVDEENEESVASLEDALHAVSNRWQKVCEWAEKRAAKLDGLAELIERTDNVFDKLSQWLSQREEELVGLKSAHHLENEEQVAEQVRQLQAAETSFESEHSSFVQLSQLSCDLVARLDDTNGAAANQVRRRLDDVTQRWDNLVARVEECSKTLVKSGKADVKQLEASNERRKEVDAMSEGVSTDTDGEEAKNLLVDKFLMHISKLSHELVPLQQWSETFTVSRKPDQVRKMMNTCQEKLVEIKEQEARVNRLQLELEHLHFAKLNSKQLKRANDAFECFAKGWARIVTKISEAMNVLTGHAQDGEETAVASKIEQWMGAVDKVISELALLPVNERKSRIEKLESQLQVQAKNVNFIEKDLVKKAILKKGLDIASKRLNSLKTADADDEDVAVAVSPSTSEPPKKKTKEEEELLTELDGQWSTAGDMEAIERDLERAQQAVQNARSNDMSSETVGKAETRRAEMEEKKRVTAASRERLRVAEKTLDEIEARVTELSKSDLPMGTLVGRLNDEKNKLTSSVAQRKEAERTAEKLLTMDDDISQDVIRSTRAAVECVTRRWDDIEQTIDLLISKADEEHNRDVQARLIEGNELLQDVENAIDSSQKSVDAEEAAEKLDTLERLLERFGEFEGLKRSPSMDGQLSQKVGMFEEMRDELRQRANDAVATLSHTMNDCEEFEKQLSDFQAWNTKMSSLLSARRAADLTTYDIPLEYQVMADEFRQWKSTLDGLRQRLQRPGDVQRMREQLQHANETFEDLNRKFVEFKRPKAFEDKLEKLSLTLSQVENSLDDMTGIEAAECAGALMEARSLLRTLEAVEEDVRFLEESRAQLTEEDVLDEDGSKKVVRKLQFSRSKVKELSERSTTCVERLEDCVEMFARLREETDEIEHFLDNMEGRLDTFAAGDRPEDDDLVNTLIAEWNRNEAAMNNAAQLQRLLKERAVKISDDVLVLKRIRADALKNRLNSWSRSLQEMHDDEEGALLEIDELHKKLSNELHEVETAPPAQIAERLQFLRADRDRLSSRTRKLAARNPRLANNEALSSLNKKWSEMEQKAVTTNDSPVIMALKVPTETAAFHQKVDELSTQFAVADVSSFLDFDSQPVASVKDYKQRIDEMEGWLGTSRPVLDDVVAQGRELAQTGRMELLTHNAIDKLDEMVNQVESCESDIEMHRLRLAPLSEQSESLDHDIAVLEKIVDSFALRDLSNVDVANETRRELAERDGHISSLAQRATAIHCSLPGKSPQQHDSTLDELQAKIAALESRLAEAHKKVTPASQTLQKDEQQSSPDRTSINSMPTLAMEAHGTTEDEGERSRKNSYDESIRKVILPDSARMDVKRGEEEVREMMEQLDEMEDVLASGELPIDNVDNAEGAFKEIDEKLANCEKCLEKHEMIINIMQSESARERIKILQTLNKQHKEKFGKLYDEWKRMEDVMKKAEGGLRKMEKHGKTHPEDIYHVEADVSEAAKQLALVLQRLPEGSSNGKKMASRVYAVEDRLRQLSTAQKEAAMQAKLQKIDEKQLRSALNDILQWCERSEAEVNEDVNALDLEGLVALQEKVESCNNQLAQRRNELAELEIAKDMAVSTSRFNDETKHEIRRLFSEASKEAAKLRTDIVDTKKWVQSESQKCGDFWTRLEELNTRTANLKRRAAAIVGAVIYTPSNENISGCHREAESLKEEVAKVKSQVQEANRESRVRLGGKNAKRVVEVLTAAASTIADVSALELNTPMSESGDTSQSASTVVDVIDKDKDSSKEETSEETSEDHGSEEEDTVDAHMLPMLHSAASTSSTPTSTSRFAPQLEHSPRMSDREEAIVGHLTQSRHWLQELERDASQTVDVADWQCAKQLWQTVQGIIDEIRMRTVEVTGTHDATPSAAVRREALQLVADMTHTIDACERRSAVLMRLAEESRLNESARTEMDLWLQTAAESVSDKRVEECSEDAVRAELQNIEKVIAQLEERRHKMHDINTNANHILDTYTKDEAHNLSHLLSTLNMRWTKFNDNIRIRRAVLEASLRSRGDFHSALAEFDSWLQTQEDALATLDEQSQNTQAIKDTAKRKQWTQTHKNILTELSAHENVLRAVEEMGKLLADGLESGGEKNSLQSRVSQLSQRWTSVRQTAKVVGERLETAEQEWEKLSDTLASLLSWIDSKIKKLDEQQPVGGNLSVVMQQAGYVKTLAREMDQRLPAYKNTVSEAHSFLMQHDLRPKLQSPRVLDDEEADDDAIGDMEQRRRGLEIHANCEKLKQKWADLGTQIENWDKLVQQAVQRLQELERYLAECQLHLSSGEAELEKMEPVEKIHLEDLKKAREETEVVTGKVDEIRLHIDDANDAAERLLASNFPLDQLTKAQVENVNRRFAMLKSSVRVRQAALKNALSDFGPSSEHFLNQSVAPPWQRAISKTNLLPYYIDHTTEKTQWEHPVWIEMCKELAQFNRVKFIAYRTAMKLRALQKRLCLDLVDQPMLEKTLLRMKGLSAEECPGLEGMVCCLLPTFEQLHVRYPNQVKSVSLAVDICINFLLNLFDPSRDGILRVLSFKIALIVFCNIPLEEKYKMLFELVSQDEMGSQKQIALLLYDLIHIPRLIGESAAFGGSNVEPSVRSCFESVRFAPSISQAGFLDWMKREPQSIVWLAVMHRLIASEDTKHQSKCNVCKMFPIVGLRYRCLACFNLDMCQNCFFSQRTAKRHKLKHPMQEYSTPTTSTEDARDFARMVRNKLRRSRRTLAYLPVEVGEEGIPLTAPPAKVHNPATEALNTHTALLATQLAKVSHEQPAEPSDATAAIRLQSPLQIIDQVEQMHKDEVDQLLQRLQIENHQLRSELERRKNASTSDIDFVATRGRRSESRGATLPLRHANGRSVPSLKSTQSQNDVMDEAKALRVHKQRLEHRSRILEQQNEQLELQLQRLKKIIHQQKETGVSMEPWSPEPPPMPIQMSDATVDGDLRSSQMNSLMTACDDLGRAMETLVVSVVYDSDVEE